MYSEDVNVVFGFDPSGLLEKVTRAPGIGIPRTLPRGCDDESEFEVIDESEFEVTGSGLAGVAGASCLGTFGTLIFGIVIVNWPIAGSVRNEAIAIAAIRISDDDLVMKYSPQTFVG